MKTRNSFTKNGPMSNLSHCTKNALCTTTCTCGDMTRTHCVPLRSSCVRCVVYDRRTKCCDTRTIAIFNDLGNIIVGGNGAGRQSNQLNGPIGLSFDRYGNLYVADNGNDRVQKFNID